MGTFSKSTWLSILIVVGLIFLFQAQGLAQLADEIGQQDTQQMDRMQKMQQRIESMKRRMNDSLQKTQRQAENQQAKVQGLEGTPKVEGLNQNQMRNAFKVRQPKINTMTPTVGSSIGNVREFKMRDMNSTMSTRVKPMRQIKVKGFID
ncbi:hypothetical protein ACFL1I_07865 [Candidatus Omnitrophota bacterium]